LNASFLAAAAREALRILLWQTGWIVAAAVASGAWWGARSGWSVLVGGAVGVVWTVYMALTLLRHSWVAKVSSNAAGTGANGFLVAWVIKVLLTISLLIIAFRSKAFVAPALLGGLCMALAAYWIWLVFVRVKHANSADGD